MVDMYSATGIDPEIFQIILSCPVFTEADLVVDRLVLARAG